MMSIKEWSWRRKLTVVFLAFVISYSISASIAQGQGIPIVGECINDSYLHVYANLNVSGEDITIDVAETYCPSGCVSGQGQYGDDCAITNRYCVSQSVTSGWNIAFFYGIGGILMLVGVGIIIDNVVRHNERKDDEFYNP